MISIIGSGKVGSAIAFLIAATSLDDIVLVNRTKEKALGQALDISNAASWENPVSVVGTDDFSMIKNSDVIVISASVAVYEKDRLEFLSQHVQLIKDIAKKVVKYSPHSKIVLVTNPADVLTYVFNKETNLSRNNIIGVASSLDSSRFRYVLANELGVKTKNITNAMVLGEHGDSMVLLFSLAKIDGKPVLNSLSTPQIDKITNDVRYYWKSLRRLKGPSVFGIAKNTTDVLRAIINDKDLAMPASVLLNGEYGISDVCLGVPAKIDKDGVSIVEIKLANSELKSLHDSAAIIKNYILQA
ncbi:MAG: NAD(P)-binding domain-containing protein [Nitrosopumilales archaeon]|nr:NAD(P)-binding domain-containing protein [Nitrosopumilales archaeon]